ncbi:hypothetical protein BJF90_26535 [Pseudonocardia sp. CNS-004]|nr:hypothetical protein BJF90_26535 [Pseudonocardia sp. CNS-004]
MVRRHLGDAAQQCRAEASALPASSTSTAARAERGTPGSGSRLAMPTALPPSAVTASTECSAAAEAGGPSSAASSSGCSRGVGLR